MAPGSTAPPTDSSISRDERSAETVRSILEAARAILAEQGLPGLSMRVVAERVGLSATAIYRYFEGKDDLVGRVVQHGYQRFGEYLQAAAEAHAPGSLERVLALGNAYVRFAFENQEYFRVLFSIQKRIPRTLDELPGGGGYGLLRRCVTEAIEAGNVRPADPDLIAHYLWTSVHGLVTLALACDIDGTDCPGDVGGPVGAADTFQAFVPFLAHGLRPDDPDAAASNGSSHPSTRRSR